MCKIKWLVLTNYRLLLLLLLLLFVFNSFRNVRWRPYCATPHELELSSLSKSSSTFPSVFPVLSFSCFPVVRYLDEPDESAWKTDDAVRLLDFLNVCPIQFNDHWQSFDYISGRSFYNIIHLLTVLTADLHISLRNITSLLDLFVSRCCGYVSGFYEFLPRLHLCNCQSEISQTDGHYTKAQLTLHPTRQDATSHLISSHCEVQCGSYLSCSLLVLVSK